jgi:hypothetical protein
MASLQTATPEAGRDVLDRSQSLSTAVPAEFERALVA